MRCEICGNASNYELHSAREMMFGFKDTFLYFECGNCDCLQLLNTPPDMHKYYPDNYYSLVTSTPQSILESLLYLLRLKRLQNAYGTPNVVGLMLQKVIGPPQSMRWLDPILSAINLNSKVLDVGCGSGELIRLLRRIGFSNLTGIDPLISKESYNSKGLRILKRYLHMLDEQFDLVMLHHSFEHMPDPHSVFSQLYRVMSPGANLLIRTPVVPSYAWNQYGVDWVQLDAPRHLFIYSVKSMMWLSEKVGLSLLNVQFDSTGFQLWGSEQYRMDIHLLDKRSHLCSTMATIFSKQAMRAFDLKAEELNGQNMGDQACFYFQKPSLH